MEIYKPPGSDPAENKGIDGQTCPACGGHLSWKIIYFQPIIPNRYRCPHCRAKLRYNLPVLFMPLLYAGIILAGSLFGYVMSDVGALEGDEKNKLVFYTAIPFMVLLASLAVEYCRRRRKLVQRSPGDKARRNDIF